MYMTLAYGKVNCIDSFTVNFLSTVLPFKILLFHSYPLIVPNLCILDRSALEFSAISSNTFFWGFPTDRGYGT